MASSSDAGDYSWAVSLDGLVPEVCFAPKSLPIRPQVQAPRQRAIPAAALVPRLGERVRVDLVAPPHPRGTGKEWPPEAVVDVECGSGRLPLSIAWSLSEKSECWRWRFGEEKFELSPFDALAAGVRGVLPPSAMSGEDRKIAVVIPNHWNELQQQRLLDSLHAEGVTARLLWRPVAASLAWLAETEPGRSHALCARADAHEKLLVVYLGLDSFELTLLELVPDFYGGEGVVLPGRRRPHQHGRLLTACGMQAALRAVLTNEGRDGTSFELAAIWESLWTSERLRNAWSALRVDQHYSNDSLLQTEGLSSLFAVPTVGCWSEVVSWCRTWARTITAQRLAGAMVVGPLARSTLGSGQSFGAWLLKELGAENVPCMFEESVIAGGLLAKGAAIYASSVRLGRPTYLDTLPQMKTIVTRSGEPCWIDLLEEEHKFVYGGHIWRRPEDLRGLAIEKGKIELSLAVAHEEFSRVREVSAPLPRAAPERSLVSIAVAIEPAQGNARLEVIPESPALFDSKRIAFDWRRMKELELDEQQYLDTFPRIFPDLLTRGGSASRWLHVRSELAICRRSFATGDNRLEWQLKSVKEALQQRDTRFRMQHVTAIGSDGLACDHHEELEHFVESAFTYLRRNDGTLTEQIVRTLAYSSTDYEPFLAYLGKQLKLKGMHADQALVTACGWCFRDPAHIALLADCLVNRIRSHGSAQQMWWKAFSEALRYRSNATRDISSVNAENLTSLALERFRNRRLQGQGDLLFRYVCLVIVYLLRRRAYEDDYLAPDGQMAISVKEEFQAAIDAARRNRFHLVGGSVDLAKELQRMIDYVDRRGSNIPLEVGGGE
jgi:hypothetical protein